MAVPEHNFYRKLMQLRAEGKVPASGVWNAHITHDDGCGIFQGKFCDCDPDIRFVEANPLDTGHRRN